MHPYRSEEVTLFFQGLKNYKNLHYFEMNMLLHKQIKNVENIFLEIIDTFSSLEKLKAGQLRVQSPVIEVKKLISELDINTLTCWRGLYLKVFIIGKDGTFTN